MPVIKNEFYHLFKIPTDVLEIDSLSWRAKGLWAYLLSRPDGSEETVESLQKISTEGKSSVVKAFDELIQHRLCARVRIKKKGEGLYKFSEYIIFDSPFSKEQLEEYFHSRPDINFRIDGSFEE